MVILINNSLIFLLKWSVNLSTFLNITWIILIVAVVLLLNLSFINCKEINRSLILFLINYWILFNLICLFLIVPININSLLRNVIFSGLTIFINESLNIPSQFLITTILSHTLNQLLFFSMVKISIGSVNISQVWGSK